MRSVSSQNRLMISGAVGVALLVALYVVLFSSDDVGSDQHDNVMDVHGAWIRATTVDSEEVDMSGVTSAAYMEIGNHGDADRRLVRVSVTGVGMVQFHQTIIEDDIARMAHQADGVMIPAGETVVLEPGGLHVMLMNLETPLVAGQEVNMILHFDDENTLEITAPIQNDG